MNSNGMLGGPVSPLASPQLRLAQHVDSLCENGHSRLAMNSECLGRHGRRLHSFTLTWTDEECNTVTTAAVGGKKRHAGAAVSVLYSQSACYNNIPDDLQYGAAKLVGDLEVDLDAAGVCQRRRSI